MNKCSEIEIVCIDFGCHFSITLASKSTCSELFYSQPQQKLGISVDQSNRVSILRL